MAEALVLWYHWYWFADSAEPHLRCDTASILAVAVVKAAMAHGCLQGYVTG